MLGGENHETSWSNYHKLESEETIIKKSAGGGGGGGGHGGKGAAGGGSNYHHQTNSKKNKGSNVQPLFIQSFSPLFLPTLLFILF